MNKFNRGLVVALGLLMFGAGEAAWSQTAPVGDAANGKRLYLAVGCFTCHGRSGQGGSYNYPAPALAETKLPLEAFKTFLRVGPKDMPAYTESVPRTTRLPTSTHFCARSRGGARQKIFRS